MIIEFFEQMVKFIIANFGVYETSNMLFSGEFLISILTVWFFIETGLILAKNHNFILDKFSDKERNIKYQTDRYSSNALTFVAILFAVISLIFTMIPSTKDVILILMFGLVLFIISYKLSVVGATKRIYWNLQQRLFNFGILSLVFGLTMFFKNYLPEFFVLSLLPLILIIILHILEYIKDFKYFLKQNKNK